MSLARLLPRPPTRLMVRRLVPTLVMPVPIVTRGLLHQAFGHFAALNPVETIPGGARAIPAVRPAAPVPAFMEEHFLGESFHHLDAGAHQDERGSGGKVEIDVYIHPCLGHRSGQREEDCKGEGGHSHGCILVERVMRLQRR